MIKILKNVALVCALVALAACSSTPVTPDHLMRGSVIRTSEQTIVVCFGSDDRIESGTMFSVYRAVYSGSIDEDNDSYSRESVGQIRILRPLDGHFARARIIDGNVQPGDMIEQASSSK